MSELFGLVNKHLSLPTDELVLKLREFLRVFHTHQLVKKVECIRQNLFRSQHRPSEDSRRLLIEGMHRLTRCDYQCLDRGLALIEVLFCGPGSFFSTPQASSAGAPRLSQKPPCAPKMISTLRKQLIFGLEAPQQ